jgi:hypothetical protein
MLSSIADRALCSSLEGDGGYVRGIQIALFDTGDATRVGVWLLLTQRFDHPDGLGDTLSEALEDAAHRVRLEKRHA